MQVHRPSLRLAVIVAVSLAAALPGVGLAAPTKNLPAGSPRVEFFTAQVDFAYDFAAGDFCPFALHETQQGWITFKVEFDSSGVAVAQTEHDHIVYTDQAFGVSVVDSFFTARFDAGDSSIIQNADGTYTYTAHRVGNISSTVAGNTIGRFAFELVIDPVSGQELSFTITRYAGQIGGLWSSFDGLAAYCAQFTA
jgi:hypothetical protein